MMITIHGFPAKTKYQDVKLLIKQECSINDFILDNLVIDTDGTKKVRIGLTDNTEGYKVMKCLDGYRMPGNFVLKAIPIGKAASNLPPQPSGFDSHPGYDYTNAPRNDYMSQPNDYNNQGSHGTGPPLSHGGIHGSMGSHGTRPSQGGPHSGPHVSGGPSGPIESLNRPSPWVAGGGNSNQWNTPMAAQIPQNSFGYTSPQANVNNSYGQQQSHPRAGFNQGRSADQGYGYTPKNVPEVVPANSRYRWVRKAEQESDAPKSTGNDEGSTEGPSFADIFDEKSQDVPNNSEEQTSKKLETSDTKLGGKYIRLERKRRKEIDRLKVTDRRRFFFWMKQGKSFAEARKLCEISLKKVPEYAVVKAEMKKRARENKIRCMSPERQARAIKLERLKGRGIPGTPVQPRLRCNDAIRVRLFDELGRMPSEKIEMLEDKILELMDAETDGNGPSFVGCGILIGTLILYCENAQTVEWLENHLPDFQLWEGSQVKISNVADEPKRRGKGQRGMAPKGQRGMPPMGQRGMAPKGQRSMPPMGQRGMAPKGQRGMPPMGQRGMAPKGQRGMPPMGQRGMAPKGQRGMPTQSHRVMRPMNVGHTGSMDMGYMALWDEWII